MWWRLVVARLVLFDLPPAPPHCLKAIADALSAESLPMW